jgi:hypothetical protein
MSEPTQLSAEAQCVVAPWADPDTPWQRVDGDSPSALLNAVRAADDPALLVANLDAASSIDDVVDHDLWVATASLLVAHGVGALETVAVQAAQRLFGTQDAINLAGEERDPA